MSNRTSLLRKAVLVALVLAGGGLLIAGVVIAQPAIAMVGVGAWVLVVIGLMWGVRFRLDQAELSQASARDEILEQCYENRLRVDRIRESQLKLHSRVALQGMTAVREQEALGRQLDEVIEANKCANDDTQRLVLRAYRESHAEWTRVTASLDHQKEWFNEQRRSASDVLGRLEIIVAEVKKASALLDDVRSVGGEDSRQIIENLREQSNAGKRVAKQLSGQLEIVLAGMEKSPDLLLKLMEEMRGGTKQLDKSLSQTSSALMRKQDRTKREVSQSLEALSQLRELVPMKPPYPLLDGWAMDPVSMLSLLQLVVSRKPRLIVECGSGTSTVWLAAALRQIGSGRLVTLDHLGDYAQLTREALGEQKLEEIAEVRCAPLLDFEVGGEEVKWYDPSAVSDLAGVDFLLVDGPPEATGPLARYPALPVMAHRLRAGALIVLDDTDRKDESQIIERWQSSFPQLGPSRAVGPRTSVMEWDPQKAG
ncbi:class I SAM-dependent methyltransferase [Luteimonas sp. MJ293]|uniref:O-methyltransferase n=1 Tax=Luteimonas sp. MJ146 TaxID=3129240 RepID=UPI0031BA2115